MNKKTYKTLEFNKILEKLTTYTQNDSVREKITTLTPSCDFDVVSATLKETTEAVGILTRRGPSPGFKITDVTYAISRIERGGAMTMGELAKLSSCLRFSKFPRQSRILKMLKPK